MRYGGNRSDCDVFNGIPCSRRQPELPFRYMDLKTYTLTRYAGLLYGNTGNHQNLTDQEQSEAGPGHLSEREYAFFLSGRDPDPIIFIDKGYIFTGLLCREPDERELRPAMFERIVDKFRKKFPEISLSTDIIVGFPGETDEDFMQSLSLINRILPNKVNVTRFSKRPYTPIFSEKDTLDALKKDRSRILNTRAEQIYHKINSVYLGKTVPIIVTEKVRKGSVMARTPSYLGVVLKENLPIGFTGLATLYKEHMYFFSGRRCSSCSCD
jgi:hypothetical protein